MAEAKTYAKHPKGLWHEVIRMEGGGAALARCRLIVFYREIRDALDPPRPGCEDCRLDRRPAWMEQT